MPAAGRYRLIHRLLLNPDTAVLATTSGGRYLIDSSVFVVVSGQATMPTISGILSDLPDGVYKIYVTRPPRPQPNLQLVHDAIEAAVGRLRRARQWRPVTPTRWCFLNGDDVTAIRILARNDTTGPRHAAVNATLWHRWSTQLAELRCAMKAYQPDSQPGHAMRIDMVPKHAPAATIGYIMPIHVHGDDRLPAEYLAQRTSLRASPRRTI